MVRKHDPVTDETFECTGDTGHCWCFALPPVRVSDPAADCKGPKHLAALLKDTARRDEKVRSHDED